LAIIFTALTTIGLLILALPEIAGSFTDIEIASAFRTLAVALGLSIDAPSPATRIEARNNARTNGTTSTKTGGKLDPTEAVARITAEIARLIFWPATDAAPALILADNA